MLAECRSKDKPSPANAMEATRFRSRNDRAVFKKLSALHYSLVTDGA